MRCGSSTSGGNGRGVPAGRWAVPGRASASEGKLPVTAMPTPAAVLVTTRRRVMLMDPPGWSTDGALNVLAERERGAPRDGVAGDLLVNVAGSTLTLVAPDTRDSGVTLAEVLAAYSLATDLGLGQPMEHLVR